MKLEFESNTSTLTYSDTGYTSGIRPDHNAAKISQMLEAGIKAAQNGDRNEARQLLVQVTDTDPDNETAWLWMASISEYPEELIIFLNNVLSINPHNARALEWMKATKSLLAKTFVDRGMEALNDASTDLAKQCFWQAVTHDDQNETAWLTLASISDSIEEKITHLQKVVSINPANETAMNALQTAKKQAAETVLRTANSAAVAGRREEAREMLQEVFRHAPELEEAWILKSYLAESFSEKITCFEKVLTLNPSNEMAISGLASLRATMAKTETKKAEQAASIAEFEKNALVHEAASSIKAENPFAEVVVEENKPNGQSEHLFDFLFDENDDDSIDLELDLPSQLLEFPSLESPTQDICNLYQEPEAVYSQTILQESSNGGKASVDIDFVNYNRFDAPSPVSFDTVNNDFMSDCEIPLTDSISDTSSSESETKFHPLTDRNFEADDAFHSYLKMAPCPFCCAENKANAFVCSSCKTVLTLSDLEMLLAHAKADQEVLRQAVERLEFEMSFRDFNVDELKNLAIGQINLKNLRQGVAHLQKAAQLNPNDVVLNSQVNFLKIRLSEIEQHENRHNQALIGRKILIVDDSPTVRKLISGKLEKSGHEVISAVDGVDALEKIKEFVPDLILLDIMMPKLDGYQVCKLIRNNEVTKDVPVVMISGKDGFFDKVRGRMAGTTGYITKPFGPEMLMKVVETHIGKRGEMMFNDELMDDE